MDRNLCSSDDVTNAVACFVSMDMRRCIAADPSACGFVRGFDGSGSGAGSGVLVRGFQTFLALPMPAGRAGDDAAAAAAARPPCGGAGGRKTPLMLRSLWAATGFSSFGGSEDDLLLALICSSSVVTCRIVLGGPSPLLLAAVNWNLYCVSGCRLVWSKLHGETGSGNSL